jgi:hypothetical protein
MATEAEIKAKERKEILDEIKRKRAAAAQSKGIVAAAERGEYGDVGQGGPKGEFDDEINQDLNKMSNFDFLANYFTSPKFSSIGLGVDLLGRIGAKTAPYTQKPLETISQGGDNIVQKAGKFLYEDAAKVAAKINSGVSFDDLTPGEKFAIASVPAEVIPGLGLAPDILRLAKNFVINSTKAGVKAMQDMTQPLGMTDTGTIMPMKMSDEGGSSVVKSSDEVKKIYPNLKYKNEADDFIKANYLKMSDEQMLKEMMKDSNKYFYEIPSSAKSLQQRRLVVLGLNRDPSLASGLASGTELAYSNVMKEFDTMTKDMDLSKMSKKQIYEFFENAYKSATGLEPLGAGSSKKLFYRKIDRFAKERGFEKLRKSDFIESADKTLFKKYLTSNKTIDNIVSNNNNIGKKSLSRFLDFIRVSSPNSKKGVDGNFDNFMKDFDLEIKDLKNTDSIFYKQYQYFKEFDKVRDQAGKKIKPFLNQIFPSPSDFGARNSLQIAHRFENAQIGKTVGKDLAGTGGTPSAYYLDISRFNSEIQPKLEAQIRKALADGDTATLNKLNKQLTDEVGAEIIIDGVKFGKHRNIEEKLLTLAQKYESNPKLMKQDGVTLKMMRDLYEGIDMISKGASNLGIKMMASGGLVGINHLTRPLGNF